MMRFNDSYHRMLIGCVFYALSSSAPVIAQPGSAVQPVVNDSGKEHSRFSVAFELGVYKPKIAETALPAVGGLGFAFGYRFQRYVQADFHLGSALGAFKAGRTITLEDGGTAGTSDSEDLISFGGRFLVPLPNERVRFSLGGGWTIAKYEEQTASNVLCISCAEQTRGKGYYGLAEAEYLFGKDWRFGLAATGRVVHVMMNEYFTSSVSDLGLEGPKDRWVNGAIKLTYHF